MASRSRRKSNRRAGGDALLGAAYAALERLERNGLVLSATGAPTAVRGGRAKRFFRVTTCWGTCCEEHPTGAHRLMARRAATEGETHTTNRQPPRVALRLLDRFVPDSEPLAGDLVEAFDGRPSAIWFWVQVLVAIAAAHRTRTTDIRPLQLVDLQPADAVERSRRLSLRFSPVSSNGSPLSGVGGLGLATLTCLVTLVRPGGVVAAARLRGSRRRARPRHDRGAGRDTACRRRPPQGDSTVVVVTTSARNDPARRGP